METVSSNDAMDVENEEMLQKTFFGLCLPFDIDLKYIDAAWSDYKKIYENITLEGDKLHWLVCALYISLIETDVTTGLQIRPKIPLCGLLKGAKLSLLHFFQKVCKWIDMGKYGKPMTQQIEQLERNFSVSSIVFEKYNAVFKDVFNIDWEEEAAQRGSTKKQKMLDSKKIFNFCWLLYISAKAHYPDINDDLVNSYHLMLCCVDFVFANVISIRNFHGVINDNFQGFISDSKDYSNVEAPSIIDAVCQSHEGLSIETKIIRKQYLKTYIDNLRKENILVGNSHKNSDLLESRNFDVNFEKLDSMYDELVVSNGMIDERLFISSDSDNRIGTPTKRLTSFSTTDERERSLVRKNLQEYFNNAKGLFPQTPLTGKRWVESKSQSLEKDIQITMPVVRLQEIARGLKPSPSGNLRSLLSGVAENTEKNIENILEEYKMLFMQDFNKSLENDEESYSLAKNRLHLSTILFYKVYEDFLVSDQKKNIDIKVFSQPLFIKCLYACCMEIVLCAYKSKKTFPWTINLFGLEPYHFFRVIELVIRTEELPREVIKHLSRIEEKILECLTWESNSSIYQHMKSVGIPKCQDVSMETNLTTTQIFMSPVAVKYTPVMNATASPAVKCIAASPARRNLFGNPEQKHESPKPAEKTVLLSPQVNTTPPTTVKFPVMKLVPINADSSIHDSPAKKMRKRYGSLGIFFRKLYHLSYIRMKHLCDNLRINAELQKKIWTCFEHSLVENNDMLRDRHLDQLIMCAVYVMCKVTKNEKSFHEIMKFYRTQPQASSDVYRRVLISRPNEDAESADNQNQNEDGKQEESTNKNAEIPNENESTHNGAVYKDLIQFYNLVYIKKMKDFALKFAVNKITLDAPTLSPLPKTKKQVASPRKLTNQHQIFISPIKSVQMTPRSKVLYCFDSDTPKKLDEINAMIKSGTKRRVNLDENIIVSQSEKRTLNGIARRAEELQALSRTLPSK